MTHKETAEERWEKSIMHNLAYIAEQDGVQYAQAGEQDRLSGALGTTAG